MNVLTTLGMWLRALTRRGSVERELEREMQFHLDMEIEQNVRNGMSIADARRQALLAFGGVQRHKEATRDERGTRWLEDFVNDTRHAWRFFVSRRAFTAAAVFTLAIGIGAATAVYSLANWVFLRPVPGVAAPHDVVRVDLHRIADSTKRSITPSGISYPNLRDVEAATPALTGLAASAYGGVHLSADGVTAMSARSAAVAGDYFGILGLRAQTGRFFLPSELSPSSEVRVAVLSDRLWRTQFNADAQIVGRKIQVNGTTFDVVGVAPPRFRGIDRVGDLDVWFPASTYGTLRHRPIKVDNRSATLFFDFIGRLSPGASPEVAQQQIRRALAQLAFLYPKESPILRVTRAHVAADLGMVSYSRRPLAETMRLLGIVVTIVLVISCANAANLLLLRGVRRRGETAIRRALGASASRLLRQHFTEGLVLATMACVVGIAMSFVFRAVLREQSISSFPALAEMPIDPRIFGFALALSLLVGVVFSLIPAASAIRSDFLAHLKESARTAAGAGLAVRRILTVVQIAAAMALVVAGLLLGRTLLALGRVDTGINVDGLVSFLVSAAPQGYDRQQTAAFRQRLADALAATPGFESSTIASHAPFWGGGLWIDLRASDHAGTDWPAEALSFGIDESYFKTLNIPVLTGRMPVAQIVDSTANPQPPEQVVVSRALARRLFGDRDPLGRMIANRGSKTARHVVVGVVGDIRVSSLRGDPDLIMYSHTSTSQTGLREMFAIVRTRLAPSEAERVARATVASVDPAVPVVRSTMLTAGIARSIAVERLFGRLVSLLAMLSAMLTAAGLYGIVAYSVAERTREIGLRMALGATAQRVVTLVGRQALALVVAGIAFGTLGAVWLSRLLGSKLFGVTAFDASTYVFAALTLLAIGALAAGVPARTATRVNPVDALRAE